MAFWNRAALLPWPLNNNNNNNNNANNNNNNGGGGGLVAAAPQAALGAPLAPAPVNPMARAAAAAGMRVRRGVRGVLGRGWAPGAAGRRQSETSTAREHDEQGEGLRVQVGEEVADRFARLKSNQHLAVRGVKRTGPVDLARASTLSDEREATERALLDRFVACMEKAVGDGVEGGATEKAEAELLAELRAWSDRVRREREQNEQARAYLLARRADLMAKQASLNAACRYIEEASTKMTLPPAPRWSSRY